MHSTNVNPQTGIHYGMISTASITVEALEMIEQKGINFTERSAREDIVKDISRLGFVGEQYDIELECRMEDWYCESREHVFMLEQRIGDQKLHVMTTWVGGAQQLWVMSSPHVTRALPCSPCVPQCGDLSSVDDGGIQCYDVPPEWRVSE